VARAVDGNVRLPGHQRHVQSSQGEHARRSGPWNGSEIVRQARAAERAVPIVNGYTDVSCEAVKRQKPGNPKLPFRQHVFGRGNGKRLPGETPSADKAQGSGSEIADDGGRIRRSDANQG